MADFFDCTCPAGVFDTIVSDACKTHRFGKVARVDFQKVLTANNFIAGTNGIETATAWTGLTSAVDDTKVTVSPFVASVSFGEAEVIEGSENFQGAPTTSGLRPPMVTVMIEDANPDQVAAINSLFCQDSGGVIGVAFVLSNDSILVNEVTDTPLTHSFIPISTETFTPGSPTREGELGSRFNYTFSFKLSADWFENSAIVQPETGFSYLTVVGV